MLFSHLENYFVVEWPAPSNIRATTTLRTGGHSKGPFSSFNLGYHVNDDPQSVRYNHEKLIRELDLLTPPYWLNQIHGTHAVQIEPTLPTNTTLTADASFTQHPNLVCAIMTADCVPILLCNKKGTLVAAIHAGWKGLLGDIIAKTINSLPCSPNDLMAWIGPAIGPDHFEINETIYNSFIQKNSVLKEAFFQPTPQQWYADLFTLTRLILNQNQIKEIFGGHWCTYREHDLFFSHRRDGGITGRMATLIWLENLSRI